MLKKLFLLLFFISPIFAQTITDGQGLIPSGDQLNWTNAGLFLNTPTVADHVFDVTNPAYNDNDDTDYDGEIQAALNDARNATGTSIIYFPQGTYTIHSEILLHVDNNDSNIIFQGAGSDKTILNFSVGNNHNCFKISGKKTNTIVYLDADISKGTKSISGSGINALNDGDWIRLSEYNFPVNDSFAQHRIGQITQISSINGNNATLQDEASKDYSDNYDLRIWKIKPIKNVGIENMKINRNDTGSSLTGENIYFSYAVNCWIKGVESQQTCRFHVSINFSSHILVSGSYFNEARNKGDGGYGYGVILHYSTTNCLIENNIFRKLRHSMVVQAGANCNVFSYNYSREQDWNYWPKLGPDLCLHGNYPYGNLFEQNVVCQISADDEHGVNGPYNAFLRNWVSVPDISRVKFHGPIWLDNAPHTAVLGNETWMGPGGNPIDEEGNTSLSVDIYGYFQSNYRSHAYMANFQPYRLNSSALPEASYHYPSRPSFLGSEFTFPSLGPSYTTTLSQSIPSYDRYNETYINDPTNWPAQTSGTLAYNQTWPDGHTLTGDIIVPSGITLTIASGTTVNLNGFYAKAEGTGQIIFEENAIINPNYCIKSGTTIKGFYPSLNSALANVLSGQTIEVQTSTTLANNISVPSGVTLKIKSGTRITLNSYTVTKAATGSIIMESGLNNIPDVRLQTGSTIEGLYTSISSALSSSTSGQAVHARGSHTLSADLTISSGKNLTLHPGVQMTFPDYKEMYVYGTLDAQGTSNNKITFTSADGTANNSENAWLVRLKNSTSDNSILKYCIFKNAQRGVYLDNSDATIRDSEILRCSYGIYNYYSNGDIISNDINAISYGIYNYYSSPDIEYNEINSTSMGIKCESYSSPDLAQFSAGQNYLHSSFVLFGVFAENNSNPYLGNGSCGLDWGRNTFDYDDFDLAVVSAGTNCTIMAENNYWGTSSPNSGMFSGDVDWQPYLTSQPSYNLIASPEVNEFNAAFAKSSNKTEEIEIDVLSLYDPDWNLKKKTRFIQTLIHNGMAQDVQQLCKDIINDYPDSTKAFFALDLLYQASRPKTMTKGYDLDSFKSYLLTLSQKKDKKTLYGSVELLLAGLEKEKGLARIDDVLKGYHQTYLAETALFQKFMYYYNENGDDKTSREVLAELETQFPSSRYTLDAYHILGEKTDDVYKYNIALNKTEFSEKEYLTILPKKYELYGAYPNPFNPSTTIKYALPYASNINISIYNMAGQKIKDMELLNQSVGNHQTIWDGKTNNSVRVASGIYIVKFKAVSNEGKKEIFENSIKITLLK